MNIHLPLYGSDILKAGGGEFQTQELIKPELLDVGYGGKTLAVEKSFRLMRVWIVSEGVYNGLIKCRSYFDLKVGDVRAAISYTGKHYFNEVMSSFRVSRVFIP